MSQKIDQGIAGSRFGIVVISKAFMARPWPQHELRGLVNRDVEQDLRILPIWHGVTKSEVTRLSPSLSDKFAIDTQLVNAQEASIRILRTVRRDLYDNHPRAELEKLASGEAITELKNEIDRLHERVAAFQCPYCGAELTSRIDAPTDPEERDFDVIETFACGFRTFGRTIQSLCPSDPQYPSLDDYTLVTERVDNGINAQWRCEARPKTAQAKKVHVDSGLGASEEAVRRKVQANYLYQAGKLTNEAWFRIQGSKTGA